MQSKTTGFISILELDIIGLLHFVSKCHLCIWKARMKLIVFCLNVCYALPVKTQVCRYDYLPFGEDLILYRL